MTPRLEDWELGPGDMLFGRIYEDPRFKDGEEVVTSRVVTFSPETGQAITKNTNYVLGKRKEA